MRSILLGTRKYGIQHAVVDSEVYDFINQWSWTYHVFRPNTTWCTAYATRVVRPDGRLGRVLTIMMHRVLAGMQNPTTGEQLSPLHCDHRDGDTMNNRRLNLREATPHQNAMNQGKRRGVCTSIYKGVYRSNGTDRFRAVVTVDRKKKGLGVFNSEIEAALAYDKAAKVLHGESARLNFPEGIT